MNKKILFAFFVFTFLFGTAFYFWHQEKTANSTKETSQKESEKDKPVPFSMPDLKEPAFPNLICNIRDYGAIDNDEGLSTNSITKAIDDCHQKGGGKVVIPAGKWKSGAIHLKSNINFHLEEGAEIVFSTDFNDYLPVVFTRFQGMEMYGFSPLIYALNCQNIALTGKGKLTGNGDFWWTWAQKDSVESREERQRLFEMASSGVPTEKRIFGTEKSGLRPSFIQFVNSKNILIEDLSIGDGPMWTIHPVYSENIIIRKIKVDTYSANTDGIVIDSSRNVVIENSSFSTGDDVIAIKSGLEEDGFRVNRPSENIIVKNCYFQKGHGAIAIGSEMSGGVRNVFVHDSIFSNTDNGIRIKSAKSRGGFIENVWVEDIKMENITNEIAIIDLSYNSKLKSSIDREPEIRNINIKNIEASGYQRTLKVDGLLEGVMENINFSNLKILSKDGIYLSKAKNINFENITLKMIDNNPLFEIKESQNITVSGFDCQDYRGLCFKIKGKKTDNISLKNISYEKKMLDIEERIKSRVFID
ncbi:MAG TPA: glycoside hydrolase family 28 protein [Candidatus Moranbacteria bacterium]|nr:glycoside hydrolase family 28 protein [Candidatus Moranbacteria bacterium]